GSRFIRGDTNHQTRRSHHILTRRNTLMDWWGYFLLGVIAYQVLKLLTKAINRTVIEYRQKRFLKLVNITFLERKKVTLISVDTSDKRAMARLERQLREQFDLPKKQN
ncbi:MAG TPA: hypothetical protein VM715_04055, partial [Candidatus Acidoferrum sp.]|nr:hypothetical protein [Candidatus Acidoferrum sp.]